MYGLVWIYYRVQVFVATALRKGWQRQTDEFSEKLQRKGGIIFNPKIYISDYGNFQQKYLIMKLIQNSNFRVQVCF